MIECEEGDGERQVLLLGGCGWCELGVKMAIGEGNVYAYIG
jgi:hypothetical protein